MPLLKSDLIWLKTKAMPYFGVKAIAIDYTETSARWPDIWIYLDRQPPLIMVTQEWKRQNVSERRKRLVHEILHLKGLQHGRVGRWRYDTIPFWDEFSKVVYRDIVSGGKSFGYRRFG